MPRCAVIVLYSYNKAQNNKGNATVVVAAGNGTADVPANLKAQLADMNDKIEILQSLAIAGIIFGAFGLALGIVSTQFGSFRRHASIP